MTILVRFGGVIVRLIFIFIFRYGTVRYTVQYSAVRIYCLYYDVVSMVPYTEGYQSKTYLYPDVGQVWKTVDEIIVNS